jgi:hypothetical protein
MVREKRKLDAHRVKTQMKSRKTLVQRHSGESPEVELAETFPVSVEIVESVMEAPLFPNERWK